MAMFSTIYIKNLPALVMLLNIGSDIESGNGFISYDKSIDAICFKIQRNGHIVTTRDFKFNGLIFPDRYVVWHYNKPNTLAIIATNKNLQIVD